jgi:hypothetical protein
VGKNLKRSTGAAVAQRTQVRSRRMNSNAYSSVSILLEHDRAQVPSALLLRGHKAILSSVTVLPYTGDGSQRKPRTLRYQGHGPCTRIALLERQRIVHDRQAAHFPAGC